MCVRVCVYLFLSYVCTASQSVFTRCVRELFPCQCTSLSSSFSNCAASAPRSAASQAVSQSLCTVSGLVLLCFSIYEQYIEHSLHTMFAYASKYIFPLKSSSLLLWTTHDTRQVREREMSNRIVNTAATTGSVSQEQHSRRALKQRPPWPVKRATIPVLVRTFPNCSLELCHSMGTQQWSASHWNPAVIRRRVGLLRIDSTAAADRSGPLFLLQYSRIKTNFFTHLTAEEHLDVFSYEWCCHMYMCTHTCLHSQEGYYWATGNADLQLEQITPICFLNEV